LTGSLQNIRQVTDAIGFRYYFNPVTGVIRHPTCSVIVSPNGTISSYTIGNTFPPKLLDDDLALAARNQVGPKADQSFMFGCLMLDPATGKLRFVVENIVRAGCVLTLLVMSLSIFFMIRNEKKTPRGGVSVSP
jgi:protein SCO1/2